MGLGLTVVLNESPDSGKTGQSAARLVSVQHTKLGETERQLSVAAFSAVENDTMTGAVHWLEREIVLVHLELEHVLGVVLPMSRRLPQLRVENVG